MSLFINNDKQPKVYKSDAEIIAPNQDIYKRDSASEMMEAQKKVNDSLRGSLQALEESYVKQARTQSRKIASMRHNLKQLNDRHIEQQEMESDVAKLLEKYSGKNEELSLKMEQQIELQKQMSSQISKQENFQHDVINRLEKQEALTEKMIRKIDHFRSILYERTNFLMEKIENGYHSTSDYIHNIMMVRKEPTNSQEKQNKID